VAGLPALHPQSMPTVSSPTRRIEVLAGVLPDLSHWMTSLIALGRGAGTLSAGMAIVRQEVALKNAFSTKSRGEWTFSKNFRKPGS
jgi:hypothetical protein